MLRTKLWAIQTRNNTFVRHEYTDDDLKVLLFRTKRRAEAWLEDNEFWRIRSAKVVRVAVKIETLF
jgi:hypothetical protein